MSELCNWRQDGEGEQGWDTSCCNRFMLNDGTPRENKMEYCCYCGKILTESPYKDEGDGCTDAMGE